MRYFPLVIATLATAVVAPTLWSGWSGDDAFYSALRGVLAADHRSLAQAMLHAYRLWWEGNGRFYPGLIVEKYLVFYLFTNLIAYKIFLVAMTLAAIELLRRCVTAYTSEPFANLTALFAAALLQQRGYHDATLAYNGMPQFVAMLVLGSLLLFRRATTTDSRAAAIGASLLYTLAALTYEVVFPVALLYLAIAKSGSGWREALRRAAPYLATAALLAAVELAKRASLHLPAGSLYASNVALAPALRTAAMQILSAVPLSYWLFDPSGIYGRHDIADFYRNAPISFPLFAALALAAWYALRAAARERTSLRSIAGIALLVVILPALPIAIATKYQHELRWGLGYLPVFFQNFGMALLLAAGALAFLRHRTARWAVIACALAVATIGAMTQATNVRLALEGQPSRTARAALERELEAGLLAGIPDGTYVAIPRRFDWIAYDDDGPDNIATRGLFFMYGGTRVTLVPPGDPRAAVTLRYAARTSTWLRLR